MLNYAHNQSVGWFTKKVTPIVLGVSLLTMLSGCAAPPVALEEAEIANENKISAEIAELKENESQQLNDESNDVPQLKDVAFTEFVSGYVTLSDGRIVMCVSAQNSNFPSITCDWEHATDEIVLPENSDKTETKESGSK